MVKLIKPVMMILIIPASIHSASPCPPSCRREPVGSSGRCSSGQGVRDVCDGAQEGQLEVRFVSVFPSVLSLCGSSPSLCCSPLSPFFSSPPSAFSTFLCFSLPVLSLSAASQTRVCGCVGRLSQCDIGSGCTARNESFLFIFSVYAHLLLVIHSAEVS